MKKDKESWKKIKAQTNMMENDKCNINNTEKERHYGNNKARIHHEAWMASNNK